MRVGISRTKAGKTRSAPARRTWTTYGITGLPTDAVFAGGLTQQSVTAGRRGDVRAATRSSRTRWSSTRVNYSWIRGRHTLKTGYEYLHINTDIDDVHPKRRGRLRRQFSRPTGAAADAATFNLVDFLYGARNTYELVNPFVFELRQRMHFGYVQDDWRVRRT